MVKKLTLWPWSNGIIQSHNISGFEGFWIGNGLKCISRSWPWKEGMSSCYGQIMEYKKKIFFSTMNWEAIVYRKLSPINIDRSVIILSISKIITRRYRFQSIWTIAQYYFLPFTKMNWGTIVCTVKIITCRYRWKGD